MAFHTVPWGNKRIFAFFREASPLSNWHLCRIQVRRMTFSSVEQYMMWCKATLFGDAEAAAKIMATDKQADIKQYGREVRNFVEAQWGFAAPAFVREGVLAKFSQNPYCMEHLLSTENALLVEASKFDKLWGAGLEEADPRLVSLKPDQWPGQNQLGNLLTGMRNGFQAAIAAQASPSAAPAPTQGDLLS